MNKIDLTSMLDGYGAVKPQRRDEAFSGSGRPRGHWRGFFEWLEAAGPDGYGRMSDDLERLRAESGIAFASLGSGSKADSLPVIGASPAAANVWLGYGHQHVGLTGGPKTGRWLAQLVAGRRPNVDLSRFAPDRTPILDP